MSARATSGTYSPSGVGSSRMRATSSIAIVFKNGRIPLSIAAPPGAAVSERVNSLGNVVRIEQAGDGRFVRNPPTVSAGGRSVQARLPDLIEILGRRRLGVANEPERDRRRLLMIELAAFVE